MAAFAPLGAYLIGVAAGALSIGFVCALKWRADAKKYRELLRIRAVK